MDRAQKEQVVNELAGYISQAHGTFVADYTGLRVGDVTNLRRQLRQAGAVTKVVKNTLVTRSVDAALNDGKGEEVKRFSSLFEGPSMLVFGMTEAISPAKVLSDFAKGNDKLKLKGGWFDGAFIDQKGVEALSKLPSREELLSQLLRLMNAPATQVVRLLQAPASSTVRLLEAYRAKLEQGN